MNGRIEAWYTWRELRTVDRAYLKVETMYLKVLYASRGASFCDILLIYIDLNS